MSLLVTTGATVTFKQLIDHVCDKQFLLAALKDGFLEIVIQYGNEVDALGNNLSKQYFSDAIGPLIAALDLDIDNTTNDKSQTVLSNGKLKLTAFAFSTDINAYIRKADLVVSHAGTGSILDTLRCQRPLIVVTNSSLMDGHQTEVALQFEKEGYLAQLSDADLAGGSLERLILQCRNADLTFKKMAEPPVGAFNNILAQESH